MKVLEIFIQMRGLLTQALSKQKLILLIAAGCSLVLIASLFLYSVKSQYVPIYQETNLSFHERSERRHFLEEMGIPFRENSSGELEVPKEDVEMLKQHFSSFQAKSKDVSKGFELFDSNTWIKGDKELQVLEMRALKGQLERDLAGFESIKTARVSFDSAPTKKFSGQIKQPKASVIVTMQPGQVLSWSQLSAITAHLAGAIHGLEPHMIAVSDTAGHLYQVPQSAPHFDPETTQKMIQKEALEREVRGYLERVLGSEHYHMTLSLVDEKLFISLCYDTNKRKDTSFFETEVKQHISLLSKELEIDFSALPFKETAEILPVKPSFWGRLNVFVFVALLFFPPLLLLGGYLYKKKKNGHSEEEKLTKIVPKINLEKLAKSLESEDPELIAWTLSYLEPERAEKIMNRFPDSFQEQVMYHLSALEEEL